MKSSRLFQVLEFGEAAERDRERESNKCKMMEKKLIETEELNFLLQSGIVLCKLAAIIVPDADIVVDQLQVGGELRNIYLLVSNIP